MSSSKSVTTTKKLVYFVRHAEAAHNILEREAVQKAIAEGFVTKEEQERARRAVLDDEALRDAPLSECGRDQVHAKASSLGLLNRIGLAKYPGPEVVLVSPLRRALMTATHLFAGGAIETNKPRFVALEALREKRTGYAADERSSVDVLEREFPHVDFSDLRRPDAFAVPLREDNDAVRARGKEFLEGPFAYLEERTIAIVTHKGWLREHRHVLKSMENAGDLQVDFDLDNWDQTLYRNAEIRIAEFVWSSGGDDCCSDAGRRRLTSVVSRSIESALASVIMDHVRHLVERRARASIMETTMTAMMRLANGSGNNSRSGGAPAGKIVSSAGKRITSPPTSAVVTPTGPNPALAVQPPALHVPP